MLLEFVAEAEAARAAVQRMGRGTIVRVSAGQKPGELLCSGGGGGGGADERRGMLAGDCVALTAPHPDGSFIGCSASCVGSTATGAYCTSGSYSHGGYSNGGYSNGVGGCSEGGTSSGDHAAGAGVSGSSPLLLEAEVVSGMPLVVKLCGAGGGAGDGASAAAEAHAARLVARGASVRLDKLGNRIAYKRQLQALFTVHDAVEP